MAAVPKIFNIPASAPFLPVLIDALRRGRLIEGFPASRDPLELARATLYLPTRRACRMARDAFLTELEGHAAILPRIVALGDLDEDEIISQTRRLQSSPKTPWRFRLQSNRWTGGSCSRN